MQRATVQSSHSGEDQGTSVSISYRVVGDAGPHLVLVHGWMMSGAVYDGLLPSLAGYRVIVPDLRGTGHSDKPDSGYTIANYAADVLTVADAAGAETFGLVGHSMGGQIAQYIAATAPTRVLALALVNTVPASGIPLPDEAVGLFRNSAGNRESQTAILNMACKQLADDARETMLDDAGSIPEACIQEAFDTWTAGGFADKLSAITAPTLVLATDDPFLPPDFLSQAVVTPIKRAKMAILPGPGHYPLVERTAETAAILHAFFAGALA